eukprot:1319107-Amphidinium_carterae.1
MHVRGGQHEQFCCVREFFNILKLLDILSPSMAEHQRGVVGLLWRHAVWCKDSVPLDMWGRNHDRPQKFIVWCKDSVPLDT